VGGLEEVIDAKEDDLRRQAFEKERLEFVLRELESQRRRRTRGGGGVGVALKARF
jgi:hypothetical protein